MHGQVSIPRGYFSFPFSSSKNSPLPSASARRRKRRAATIFLILAFLFVAGIVARVYLFFIGMRAGGRLAGGGAMSTKSNETHYLWGWRNRAKAEKKFDQAQSDSCGFFNAIPNDEWTQMKHETMVAVDLQYGVIHRTSDLLKESGANIYSNLWWNDNWKVSNDLHRCCTMHIHSYSCAQYFQCIRRSTSFVMIKFGLADIGSVTQ